MSFGDKLYKMKVAAECLLFFKREGKAAIEAAVQCTDDIGTLLAYGFTHIYTDGGKNIEKTLDIEKDRHSKAITGLMRSAGNKQGITQIILDRYSHIDRFAEIIGLSDDPDRLIKESVDRFINDDSYRAEVYDSYQNCFLRRLRR